MKKQQLIGLTVLLLIAAATAALFGAEPPEGPADGETARGTGKIVSPDGAYTAIARTTETQASVTIVETESGRSCEVLLPDERPIPENTFLPEDWGQWLDENTLLFTVGRDGEEQQTYRCFLGGMTDEFDVDHLTSDTYLQTTEPLSGSWDFDHDGTPETVTLVILSKPWSMPGIPMYALNIQRQDGTLLWARDDLALAHVGWASIFARTMEGKDYLFCFYPTMYQGDAEYTYEQIFFDLDGTEALSMRNAVTFDINFGSPHHECFDAADIADFLWDVRCCLTDSTLLVSTEGGELLFNVPGLDMQAYLFGDLMAQAESRETLEAAIRREEVRMKEGSGL